MANYTIPDIPVLQTPVTASLLGTARVDATISGEIAPTYDRLVIEYSSDPIKDGPIPRQEVFIGEVAPVNADTLLVLELTYTPVSTDCVRMFVNGKEHVNGAGKDFSVGGTDNKRLTWLGGTAPGTGTATYALAATDEVIVVYASEAGLLDQTYETEDFTGETAPQGSDTTLALALAYTPVSDVAVRVSINGKACAQGSDKDYTVGGAGNQSITWKSTATYAIAASDIILVTYTRILSGAITHNRPRQEVHPGETARINADTVLSFELANYPISKRDVLLFVNGLLQAQDRAYVVTGIRRQKIKWTGGVLPGTGGATFPLEFNPCGGRLVTTCAVSAADDLLNPRNPAGGFTAVSLVVYGTEIKDEIDLDTLGIRKEQPFVISAAFLDQYSSEEFYEAGAQQNYLGIIHECDLERWYEFREPREKEVVWSISAVGSHGEDNYVTVDHGLLRYEAKSAIVWHMYDGWPERAVDGAYVFSILDPNGIYRYLARILSSVGATFAYDNVQIESLFDPELCPNGWLSQLAAQFGMTLSDIETEVLRRMRLREATLLAKARGMPIAVTLALRYQDFIGYANHIWVDPLDPDNFDQLKNAPAAVQTFAQNHGMALGVRTRRGMGLKGDCYITHGDAESAWIEVPHGYFESLPGAYRPSSRVSIHLRNTDGSFVVIPTYAAEGTVTLLSPTVDALDGDTVTLDDGVNPAITFEFDDDGIVVVGNTLVTIGATPFFTMQNFINAVNATVLLTMMATDVSGALPKAFLLNQTAGTVGEITIVLSGASVLLRLASTGMALQTTQEDFFERVAEELYAVLPVNADIKQYVADFEVADGTWTGEELEIEDKMDITLV